MNKIILAGYGGQGMLLCGQLLAYAAMNDGKHVTWLPSYGPEMRGGAASCSVVISEKPIGSPFVQNADAVVALNKPSFDKFHSSVKPGGSMIYNSSMIEAGELRDDIHYYAIDFTEIAMGLNNIRVANMVALGSLNEVLQCVDNKAIVEALEHKFGEGKAHLIEINKTAIKKGVHAVKEVALA
jgi:2-oxoglutarate ferredoxin oxidoreductase subunit gamma